MYFASIFLPNMHKNCNEMFWWPAMFVETFDCNIAFIDRIVQPLTTCQLFVGLSSITLKNTFFVWWKIQFPTSIKMCSFKNTLPLNPSFERMAATTGLVLFFWSIQWEHPFVYSIDFWKLLLMTLPSWWPKMWTIIKFAVRSCGQNWFCIECNKVLSILKKYYLSALLHFCYCHKQIVQGEFWIGLHLLVRPALFPVQMCLVSK